MKIATENKSDVVYVMMTKIDKTGDKFMLNSSPIHDGVWSNPASPHFILLPPDNSYPVLHSTVYSASYAIESVDGDRLASLIEGLAHVIAKV